jgi:hypothetical protein
MKCQACDQAATHHVTEMMAGKPVEHHLCEAHFQEVGALEPPLKPADLHAAAAFMHDAALCEALQDNHAHQRLAAYLLPALCLALLDEHPQVRIAAAFRLMMLGPDARSALQGLEAAMQDADERVRKASQIASEAIRMGEQAVWFV